MELRKEVLDKIVPSADEQKRIDRAVADLISLARKIARERSHPFEPILVGSIAKGTHLKNPDIDLFLRFPVDFDRDAMGDIDKKIGREILDNPEERYAEHPYISGSWQGFRTDLVPCYNVHSGKGRISAVDRTPFHTEYVKKHLNEEQRDEVRLFKQFSKGIGVYGAEAKIQGFSGYLCEILILRFCDFESTIDAARKWKARVELYLEHESSRKFDEAFIFIDPVDPGRNVASPVSLEKLTLFIEACKAYRKKPNKKFFFPERQVPWEDQRLSEELKDHPGTVLIELPPLDVVDDVLWPQLRKTGTSIFETLQREGFAPKKFTLASNDDMNLIMLDCEEAELPETYIHMGPPAKSAEVEKFVGIWKGKGAFEPVLKKGRWQVEVVKKERSPKDMLLKNFRSVGLGKGFRNIDRPIIASGKELMAKKYRMALTEHFDKTKPWER